jgi:hypothetical protein
MPRGAFVMLDALGFKGIWRRDDVKSDPSLVLRKLEEIGETAKEYASDRLVGTTRIPLRGLLSAWEVTLLSDTIAAGIFLNEAQVEETAKHAGENALLALGSVSLSAAAEFASEVLRIAATQPPLALRGAIAWGNFIMRPRCMVGPAVDEAAECAQKAEAAVVWCTPSALQVLERVQAPLGRHPLIRWRVPFKGGQVYDTFVVSPFDRQADTATRAGFWSALEPSFDRRRLGVEVKRQRTAEFVQHASQTLDSENAAMEKFWGRPVQTAGGEKRSGD